MVAHARKPKYCRSNPFTGVIINTKIKPVMKTDSTLVGILKNEEEIELIIQLSNETKNTE
jgi:hypothetical protein